MNEPIGRAECFASEMNAAMGRYNEFIDVRDPDMFNVWHHRPGLRCLVCRHPVTAYQMSKTKNIFVRHVKGAAVDRNSRAARSARETFLHYRLKHWVCDELTALGSRDADVEVPVGPRRPDVFGHIADRGYAVEIQWSPLEYGEAQTRTQELRAAGADEVLWLTRTCSWVEQLPALGITTFDPAGDDYRAHTGFLAWRVRAGLRVTETSVRNVLRQWVGDEIAWAYRDHKKAGWATVTDWQQHTKAQADTIADQDRRLDAARAYVVNKDRELAAAQSTAEALQTKTDRLLGDKTTLLSRVKSLRAEAIGSHTEHVRELEEANARAGRLKDEVERLAAVNTAAKRTIESLQNQVAGLVHSVRGWKTGALALAIACLVLLIAWMAG